MKKRRSTQKKRQNRQTNSNKLTMIGIIMVACLVLAVLVVQGYSLKKKIAVNNERLDRVETALEQENARTEEITELKEKMASDEYIEQVAREKLGMVKENEILFKEVD